MSKRFYTIKAFCKRFGISRSHLYRQINHGHLKVTTFGRRKFISHAATEAWLKTAPYNKRRKTLAQCESAISETNLLPRKTISFADFIKLFTHHWQ